MKKNILLSATFLAGMLILSGHVQAQEYELDKTYSIDKNGTIDLRSDDADVFITGTDREDVHVYVYRKVITRGVRFGDEDFEVEVDERDGDLVIAERSRSSSVWMGYTREEYKIEIEAPSTVSLKVRGDDDDYIIRNIDGDISMNLDDGDADLKDCDGERFSFDIDDGDVFMNAGRGSLYLRVDDGDISITNAEFTKIDAVLDDGDLILATSLDDDGDYEFRVDDGTLDMMITSGGGEFDVRHDDGRVSADGNFRMVERSDHDTRVVLDSGDAKVRIRAEDARVKLSKM